MKHVESKSTACPRQYKRSDGTVAPCEYGALTRVTFHHQADIDTEAQAIVDAVVAQGVTPTPFDIAKTKAEAARGKNLHSVKAEADHKKATKDSHDALMAFHAADTDYPHV